MPVSAAHIRALDGKPVEIAAAAGAPTRLGVFRVSETNGPLPAVEIVTMQDGTPVSQSVPQLLLPAILLTEREGRYTFWEPRRGNVSANPFVA